MGSLPWVPPPTSPVARFYFYCIMQLKPSVDLTLFSGSALSGALLFFDSTSAVIPPLRSRPHPRQICHVSPGAFRPLFHWHRSPNRYSSWRLDSRFVQRVRMLRNLPPKRLSVPARVLSPPPPALRHRPACAVHSIVILISTPPRHTKSRRIALHLRHHHHHHRTSTPYFPLLTLPRRKYIIQQGNTNYLSPNDQDNVHKLYNSSSSLQLLPRFIFLRAAGQSSGPSSPLSHSSTVR